MKIVIGLVVGIVLWIIISIQNSVGLWDWWSTRGEGRYAPLPLSNELPAYHLDSVIVLRTHRWSSSIEASWNQMREDLGQERVFVVYDVSGNRPLPPILAKEPNVIPITESECKSIHPLHQSMWATLESQLTLISRHLARHPFRYLWLIEYDVRCVGSWKDVLNSSIHHCPEADFVADNVQPMSLLKNATWCWWWRNPYQRGSSSDHAGSKWKCFLPVSRYSARFLKRLERDLGKSTDFCEIYLPTMCMKDGDMTVDSLLPSCLGYPFQIRSMTEEEFRKRRGGMKSLRLYHAIK